MAIVVVALSCLLALLPAGPLSAADDDGEGFDWDGFRTRTSAQIHGLRTGWSGSVTGDITRRLDGRARLMFAEDGRGRLNVSLWLSESGGFYDGVAIHGVISCARGSRSYPVWVQRSAYEQQPYGRLSVRYTDPTAIASKRAGVSPTPQDDTYRAEQGTVTLQLLEDRLELRVDALLDSGPILSSKPPYRIHSRIQMRASASVERTLDNEDLFDTTRCGGREPFELVSIKPEDGRANVLLDRPEILVELSREVHPESLENPDLVVVRTRVLPPGSHLVAPEGQETPDMTADRPWTPAPADLGSNEMLHERVAGTLDLKDPRTVRFVPDAPLRSGVRYQVDIASGDDGIRSTRFHVLEEVPPTLFTTRVKPDEVRLHAYQTTRDAPLLLRKPTMARVYVEWVPHADVHPDWQVEEYEIDLEITRNESRSTVFPRKTHWVTRPDLLDDEDRRVANDTVNRFGWKPRASDVRRLVARVRPHDPWPQRRESVEDVGVRGVEYVQRQVDDLIVQAYLVRTREWREEPPALDVFHDIIRGFNSDNEFARQVYPVVQVRGVYGGVFTPALLLAGDDPGLGVQAAFLHDHVGRHSAADIVVGYYPPSIEEGRGQGIVGHPGQQANVVVMPVRAPDGGERPAIVDFPLVSHEYGHVFGLKHVPRADEKGERAAVCDSLATYLQPSDGIEGFRIAAGGGRGWSKSSTTGNGEVAPTLKQLMFPCVHDPRRMWWILDDHYRELAEELPGLLNRQRVARFAGHAARERRDVSHAVQIDRSPPRAPKGVRWMLVSGFSDGASAHFFPTVDLPRPGRAPPPDSPFSLAVEAADGTRLASRTIAPPLGAEAGGQGYFSGAVEVRGEPARIRLLRDGEQIGEITGASAPRPPRILAPADGAVLQEGDTLRWEPADVEGTLYSVRYRPDASGAMRVLAALTEVTELPLTLHGLPPGDDAVIEVVAHAGLHEATASLRVDLPRTLRPLAMHPLGEVAPNADWQIEAYFNTPLDADSVARVEVQLIAEDGSRTPVEVIPAPSGDGVLAAPTSPLEPNRRYTVHLGAGLRSEDGRTMVSAARWSFATGAVDPAAASNPVAGARHGHGAGRPVQSLPPIGQAPPGSGMQARGTGELNLLGAETLSAQVDFSLCSSLSADRDGILLEGRFHFADGAEGILRLQRETGRQGPALTLSLIRPGKAGGNDGTVVAQLSQESGPAPVSSGLTVREDHGHWSIGAMWTIDGNRSPLLATATCGRR